MEDVWLTIIGDTNAIESVSSFFDGFNWMFAPATTPVFGQVHLVSPWNWYGIQSINFPADFSGLAGLTVALRLDSIKYNDNVFGWEYTDTTSVMGNVFTFGDCNSVPAPVASFIPSITNVCAQQYASITNNCTGTGLTYHWDFPGGYPWVWDTPNPPAIEYSSAGSWWAKVTITDTFHRVSRDSVLVTVWPYIWSSISPLFSPPLCEGDSLELSTTTPASSYQWLKNSTAIVGATGTTFEAKDAGYYQVAVTDANGCQFGGGQSVNLSLNASPDLFSITAFGMTNDTARVCKGSQTTLQAIYTGNTWGGNPTYEWSTGSSDPYVTVDVGSYTLTITDPSGNCPSAEKSAVVAEWQAETPTITSSLGGNGTDTMCAGASLTLYANMNNASSIMWSNGDLGNTTMITQAGNYYFLANDIHGCYYQSNYFTVVVNPCDGGETGIETTSSTSLISTYPNPFTDKLYVDVPKGNYTMTLFTITGQKVLEKQISGPTTTTIERNGLEPGSYLLEISGSGDVYRQKVQVQ